LLAERIVERLEGSADTLSEAEMDDVSMLKELDNIVLLCEECNWWCLIEEMDEGVCDDCRS